MKRITVLMFVSFAAFAQTDSSKQTNDLVIQYGSCLVSVGTLSNENNTLKAKVAELEKKLTENK